MRPASYADGVSLRMAPETFTAPVEITGCPSSALAEALADALGERFLVRVKRGGSGNGVNVGSGLSWVHAIQVVRPLCPQNAEVV